jgi:hypothetical protein
MTIASSRGRSVGGASQIAVYFGLAYLFYYLCTPTTGLASVAIQWLLKNRLNLPAQKVASFQLIIAAPTYIAFLFGLARDRWSFAVVVRAADGGRLWLGCH